ncbi:hypothetical protein R1sor_020089 [Riccia sorocarpa]|uniref:GPI inositol-deacylase n=1 Tax=Riccia sorocarpa TaxID=122646 RepID=A0ABD3IH43_9MARC
MYGLVPVGRGANLVSRLSPLHISVARLREDWAVSIAVMLVQRVQTTLRGSADDIGWLLKDLTLPHVQKRTERFVQLLGRISNGVHVLPDNLVYVLVPGLFSNHGPLYFVDTKKYFSRLGLSCHIARIPTEVSVETNARELKVFIEELFRGTGKRVVLLGHSKGGVHSAAALSSTGRS